jgi:predicted RNase H-like HicB family nuclease
MARTQQLTGIIEREGNGYVALCPELDIASQGDTVEEARAHLIEALEGFFDLADPSEIKERLHTD